MAYKDLLERMVAYEKAHKQPIVEKITVFDEGHFDAYKVSDEAIKAASTDTPTNSLEAGIADALNKLIIDEWEAIAGYNDVINMLKAENRDESEIAVLSDIVAEENVHVGQLQKLMEIVSPNASQIKVGEQEAEEQLK